MPILFGGVRPRQRRERATGLCKLAASCRAEWPKVSAFVLFLRVVDCSKPLKNESLSRLYVQPPGRFLLRGHVRYEPDNAKAVRFAEQDGVYAANPSGNGGSCRILGVGSGVSYCG